MIRGQQPDTTGPTPRHASQAAHTWVGADCSLAPLELSLHVPRSTFHGCPESRRSCMGRISVHKHLHLCRTGSSALLSQQQDVSTLLARLLNRVGLPLVVLARTILACM